MNNYLITVFIYQSKAEEIGDALIEHVITKYCVSDWIIMDQGSAFMSSLMNYLFSKLDIKIKTVAPYNHQLLQAEDGIKSLLTILTKHLANNNFSLEQFLVKQEKFECQAGLEPASLGVQLIALTWHIVHAHCMLRVLWDAYAHAHHPLIEEMLMCMYIGELSPFTQYDSQIA